MQQQEDFSDYSDSRPNSPDAISNDEMDPAIDCYNCILKNLYRPLTTMMCLGWEKDAISGEYVHMVTWGVKDVDAARNALLSFPEINSAFINIVLVSGVSFTEH